MEEKVENKPKYNTVNELKLKVTGAGEQELINEECCTCINIILQNDGKIQTSFLGAHNPEIIRNLERALKVYFKGLKKTLKAHYVECDDLSEEHSHEEQTEHCHDHEKECCKHKGSKEKECCKNKEHKEKECCEKHNKKTK